MFERFTNQSRRVVVLAQEEARMLDHNYIGTEHLLLGLLHEGRGSAARALQAMDVTLQAVRDQVIEIIGRGQAQPSGHIPFTPRAKKSLELSLREALQLGDSYIGTGHLLLGLIHQGDNVAVKILGSLGADLKDLRARVTEDLRGSPEEGQDVPSAEREQQQQLKSYLRGEAKGLLDTIDDRLTAIERRLGIRRPVPVVMRNLEVRIAQVRRDKEAAIDVQDFRQAAALRDAEKQLIEERARVEQETAAGAESGAGADAEAEVGTGVVAGVGAEAEVGTGVVAGVGAEAEVGTGVVAGVGAEAEVGTGVVAGVGAVAEVGGESGELGRLRARVADLESRLREHGIDPDEPGEAPAATG